MAMTEPLIFVIATAAQLPQASTCLEVLQEVQATEPSTGFALRIFSKGWASPLSVDKSLRATP